MNLREQIAAYGKDLKVKKINIEGFKEFYIREVSAGDRESFEEQLTDDTIGNRVRATIFIKSVCDKDGSLLYTDDDLEEVNGYKFTLLTKVFNESNKLNGVAGFDAVDDSLKNS